MKNGGNVEIEEQGERLQEMEMMMTTIDGVQEDGALAGKDSGK